MGELWHLGVPHGVVPAVLRRVGGETAGDHMECVNWAALAQQVLGPGGALGLLGISPGTPPQAATLLAQLLAIDARATPKEIQAGKWSQSGAWVMDSAWSEICVRAGVCTRNIAYKAVPNDVYLQISSPQGLPSKKSDRVGNVWETAATVLLTEERWAEMRQLLVLALRHCPDILVGLRRACRFGAGVAHPLPNLFLPDEPVPGALPLPRSPPRPAARAKRKAKAKAKSPSRPMAKARAKARARAKLRALAKSRGRARG
ncbi:MAG: hypothetical protein GY772_24240 [bacterium]|nr:hypothetical protein [bacterium]